MSEDASEQQFSRGSSLSLFSGFGGASTVSGGGSDPGCGGGFGGGAVNVEELTDDQLEATVDDLKTALRILILETLMFESFYERLLAGQAQIRATPTDSGGASRKGSVITGSDTGSESDSQPPTAGNSMLDVSRRSSKRRSSSRASIGSKAARAKILRLSAPQKCGIAAKEMERIERELADFRLASRKKSAEAMAEIDERALRLEELKLSKARVVKVLAKAKVTRHDEEHYDYDKVAHCLKGDVDAHERHLEKLRTKNGVVASRIRKRLSGMRLEQSASDESGPVDLEQLQLENANLAAELERQNEAVIRLRKEMAAARRRKTAYQRDLGAQVERSGRLAREREAVKSEAQVVSANVKQVARNTRAAERRTARLSALLEKYEAPTTDDYMEVKWREMRLAEKEKVARRREHLERLKSSVERQRRRRARSASVRGGRAAPSATVMKGRTFNIEFRTVHQLADELKSGLQI